MISVLGRLECILPIEINSNNKRDIVYGATSDDLHYKNEDIQGQRLPLIVFDMQDDLIYRY